MEVANRNLQNQSSNANGNKNNNSQQLQSNKVSKTLLTFINIE